MADLFAKKGSITSSGVRHYRVTVAVLNPKPRAIRCRTAGTITLLDDTGVSETYPMVAGEVLMFRAQECTSLGTGTFTAWY